MVATDIHFRGRSITDQRRLMGTGYDRVAAQRIAHQPPQARCKVASK